MVFIAEAGERTPFTTLVRSTTPAFTFVEQLASPLRSQGLANGIAMSASMWIESRSLKPRRIQGEKASDGLAHGEANTLTQCATPPESSDTAQDRKGSGHLQLVVHALREKIMRFCCGMQSVPVKIFRLIGTDRCCGYA